MVSMGDRIVAARVPDAKKVNVSTYRAKLKNGASIELAASPRTYYTAAGVARMKAALAPHEDNAAPAGSMGGTLQVFTREGWTVRTVKLDGEPWLVGKDVAQALGYKEPTKAAREKVDAEDRGVSKIDTPSGVQQMTIINESGLYSLVLSSKIPGAKKFRRWVTSEVLPSIRRHGIYAVDQLLDDPDLAIKAFTALKEEREKRKAFLEL